jgi:hypothetical protein
LLGRSKPDLTEQARTAAEVRAHQTNPDVVALQVENIRRVSDLLIWTGIIAGLAFTMTNVQKFAAGDADKWSPEWTAAWLLDPTVSLVFIGVLLGEQVLGRYQVTTKATHDLLNWLLLAKWFCFAATYVMNTWESWQAVVAQQAGFSGVVLHSVPPVLVLVAAEAGPRLRDRLTEAIHKAAAEAGAALPKAARPVRPAPAAQQTKPAAPGLAATAGRAARRAGRALGGAVQQAAVWLIVAQAGAASVGLTGPAVASGPARPGPIEAGQAGPDEAEQAEQAGPDEAEQAGPDEAEQAGPRLRVVPAESASERTAPFAPIDRPVVPQVDVQDLPEEVVAKACVWAEEQHRAGVKLTRTAVLDGLRDDKIVSVGHTMRTPLVKAVQAHVATLQSTS